MRWIGRLGLAGACVGLVLAAQAARAQGSCTFTDENGKTVTWPNCQPPAGANGAGSGTGSAQGSGTAPAPAPGTSPAKGFPYPGETPSAPSAPAASPSAPASGSAAPAGQGAAGNPAAGGAGQAAGSNAPAADKFPFPESDSSGGAAKPSGDGLKDAGSSGSSSSSGDWGSSSSSNADNSDAGPLGDTDPAAKAAEARRAARHKKGIDFHLTPDQREVEDLKVASFYQNDGDFKGAYERATDAVSLAGDDAEAHLALGDAARRLGKLDEAEANYKKCLTLDPVPKTKKAAERALKEMSGAS